MIDTPTWFGPPDASLFGWFCEPDDRQASLAVLLCPPIGEEEHNAHETFRRLASDLAAQGIASLRFDYHGTGDSLGRWSDPGRGAAWINSVTDAFEVLRGLGVARIAAVGMRIGATLAATAAAGDLIDLDALVMWDPCSGNSMLREGQARRPSPLPPPPGSVDTPGYLYPPEAVEDLRALDPATIDPGSLAPRVLVLTRGDRPTPRKLRARLDGPGVEWAEAVGQCDLLDLPMTDNAVPAEALAHIVAWLCELDVFSPVPLAVVAREQLDLRMGPDQPVLTERVVSLGPAGLFGIVTESTGRARGPLLVLINVANDRHVGPGRRWVDCARSWAGAGFRVLRLDQSGCGDSPGREGQEFGVLYAREWLEDMPEALRAVPGAESDLALISLCSGAYSSMEAAFHVPVAAVYATNVILHAKVTSRSSALWDPRRVAARPPSLPFLRLQERHPRAGALLWRIYRQVTVWNAPMATVSALTDRGTDVILIMGPNDGRHFSESVFWTAVHTWRMRRSGRYRLVVDPRIDHALMTQEGQDFATAAVTADLLARYPADEMTPRLLDLRPNRSTPATIRPPAREPAAALRRRMA